MVEPASLTIASVLALAGLFNDAIDCFEYVQFGRNFGKDFQTDLIKLDDARLRLSRWGESVGLNVEIRSQDMAALKPKLSSDEAVKDATERLQQISELFDVAKEASDKLMPRPSNDDPVFQGSDMQSLASTLHGQMRQLSLNRRNPKSKASLRQRVHWALYDKNHFERLIKDIIDLVSGLTELFPAAKSSQQTLCKAEVDQIDKAALAVLKQAISGQDSDLEKALSTALTGSSIPPSSITFGNNNSGMQFRDNPGNISGLTFGKSPP